MKKSEYFILTPSYQTAQKDTYTTVWPTQKKVSTEKSENQSEKLGFSSIIPQANGIIEKIQKGIT